MDAPVGEIDIKPIAGLQGAARRTGSGGGPGVQSSTSAAGAPGTGSAPARRLGRGLSALIGSPLPVDAGVRPDSRAAAVPRQPIGGSGPSQLPTRAGDMGSSSAPAATSTHSATPNAPSHQPAPEGPLADSRERVLSLALDEIVPSPHQPRKVFEASAIDELAASIRSAGVIQPIVVRLRSRDGAARTSVSSGGDVTSGEEARSAESSAMYELIAGERRWRAARAAGLARVPAILATISDEQAAEWALIENLQRTDLSAMERADALKSLSEKFNLTHAELARRVGLDRSSVTNLIRLTELEDSLRALLQDGRLSLGHGKALLMLKPGSARERLGQRAEREGWSVRKLEQAAANDKNLAQGNPPVASTGQGDEGFTRGARVGVASGVLSDASFAGGDSASARAKDAALRDLERQLGEHLGTKVRVRTDKTRKRGSLVVSFYDLDQFDGLMSKMGFALR